MSPYFSAFFALLPVIVLIVLMVKNNPWPSTKALPLAAVMMYMIKLGYFESAPNITNATVLVGTLTAFTPVMIIWGAILLFTVMERTGCLDTIRYWLNSISSNRVAQLMIIGWAFSFMIEGASGFGTPAALAAPLLAGLGFQPMKIAILCLIMNSVPVSFGAVGTPTWFGFGQLGLSEKEIADIGVKSVFMHAAAAMIIPIIALRFAVTWKEIKQNIVFIYIAILGCVVPYVIIAFYSYEFPALCAGFIGFLFSIFAASHGWGLHKADESEEANRENVKTHSKREVVKALFPLWGSVLVLVVTRISQLGIKDFLNDSTPCVRWDIGTLGDIAASPSGVIGLHNVFNSGIGWSCKALYIPALIPFFLISFLTFLLYRMEFSKAKNALKHSTEMIKNPLISLAGALILVSLLMSGGENSCAHLIGVVAAELAGGGWMFCAPYLGALGSFFAGSNTISNLTFGGIQQSVAHTLNLDTASVLAMQSVGGAMGNMVCINNIVAVGSILGLADKAGYEGHIIKRTVLPMLLYGIIAIVTAMVV